MKTMPQYRYSYTPQYGDTGPYDMSRPLKRVTKIFSAKNDKEALRKVRARAKRDWSKHSLAHMRQGLERGAVVRMLRTYFKNNKSVGVDDLKRLQYSLYGIKA